MRLRLLNVAYLFAAVAAVGWVLTDLYSLLIPGGKNYPATSEAIFSSVLNLPIVAGVLVFLYALYKFPKPAPEHNVGDSFEESTAQRYEDPFLKSIEAMDLGGGQKIDIPAEDESVPEPVAAADVSEDDGDYEDDDDDPSLDEESTVIFSDSVTLDMDDYFEEEMIESEDADYIPEDLPESVKIDLESDPLDPMVEAATFANFGQFDNAVNVLLEAFDRKGSDHDVLATAIFHYLDKEVNNPMTSAERAAYTENRKTEIITMFTTERANLSDETWKKILPAKRARKNNAKDDDADEVLLVNWH